MKVLVEIYAEGTARPPAGAPVLVQVRDTSLQDAPAIVLGDARGAVTGDAPLASAEVRWRDPATSPTVWAHVDVDGDGRVSRGDFVTVRSHAVPPGDGARVRVTVRRVD